MKQWVPHLADAVRAAERDFILPDPEDEYGLEQFSAFLAQKVPQAQVIIVRFLSDPVVFCLRGLWLFPFIAEISKTCLSTCASK